MLVSDASLPVARQSGSVAAANGRRLPGAQSAGRAAGLPDRAASDPQAAEALAGARKTADKSRTARRDALSRDLQRLLEVARKLNGVGDLRSNADALQALGREIAKLARALADAERALPASARRGMPAIAVPQAPPAAAGAPESDAPVSDTAASDTAVPGETKPGEAAVEPGERPASAGVENPERAGDPGRLVEAAVPLGVDSDQDEAARTGASSPETADAGRSGTRTLLKYAADMLKKMRETVRKAALAENLLDPEAAKQRFRAVREFDGFIAELNALALDFAEPVRGQGVDLSA